MSRILRATVLCGALALGACTASAPAAVDPNDPAITATVDSLLAVALDGAARADADRALQVVADSGEVTLLVGNVMFTDLNKIRSGFRETYAGLEKQDQTLLEKRIQVISPGVAIATIIGEGTYTDKAGWTSEPVDIATTLVFVKESRGWRVRHAQQSITR